jgi:hypothetical protein
MQSSWDLFAVAFAIFPLSPALILAVVSGFELSLEVIVAAALVRCLLVRGTQAFVG